MPKAKLAALKHEEVIFSFLKQSHISDKYVARLQTLARSTDPRIADIAALALEVAQVQRYKRGRLRILAQKRPDLLTRLEESGLILAHHW
jgi:hypothetical protein